jgi:hypothetical protein
VSFGLGWVAGAALGAANAAALKPGPCEPERVVVAEPPPRWDEPGPRASATAPGTRVTLAWVITQLIPSPELGFGSDGALFGLRWQLTPFSYSFGVDRRLSPLRAFVVEPLFRTSGSVELFFAPEYLAFDTPLAERFGFRTGVRAFFPVVEKGDYVSVSLGAAYARFGEREGASYQAGAYILFGFLGIEQSYTPALAEARWLTTFNLRFF